LTPSPLQLIAGPAALAHIERNGLRADDISTLIGASGGPKWFSLFGIDQFLLREFFTTRRQPLELLGSSAGAWRFACYAQQDGASALRRFCDAYRTLCYPKTADVATVTQISHQVIDAIFPTSQHMDEVLQHPVFRLNLIVAAKTGRPFAASRLRQLAQISAVAAANLLHRGLLGRFYHRLLFCHHDSQLQAPLDLPSERVVLTQHNLAKALLASGSIPLVLDTVRDIPGLPYADYVDGGLTDYHFGWPSLQTPKRPDAGQLVLYPHFYPHLSPGWFDKALPWRRIEPAQLDNLVLLCPTPAWVRSLPFGKIPDRSDFAKLTDDVRMDYWQQVTQRSFELADALRAQNFTVSTLI